MPHGGGAVSQSTRLDDYLLARGRRFTALGRATDARAALQRLLRQPDVLLKAKAEAHELLGEIELARGRFRRARRHFATAIGLQPFVARTYLRYAAAVEADLDANPRKARAALRRAIDIDATEPGYWTALGRVELRSGHRGRALRAFRHAARLSPGSTAVLAEVVDGLVGAGREREAHAVLTAAWFRAPRDAGIIQLYNQFRFDCTQRRQARIGRDPDESAILPFPERTVAPAAVDASPVVIRVDQRSRPRPHILRLMSRPENPRQAR
jgi:predicted Zn-dependent protease